MKKAGLFIDGSNLYAAAMSLEMRVDYVKLLDYFKRDYHVVRAFYFTALPPKEVKSSLRPMVDFIEHHGYTVIQKETKSFYDENTKEVKLKGNMDVDIAAYIWKYSALLDEVVLFSGDGDFRPIVERVQELGLTCRIVSTMKGTKVDRDGTRRPQSMVADILRRQADSYTDLSDIQESITQQPRVVKRRFLSGDI